FFYMYVYLLACVRRKQYRLIKWTVFIPFYWLMMSAAACMALYQLIWKPHYWEKTEHGLHLSKKGPTDIASLYASSKSISDEETQRVPIPPYGNEHKREGGSNGADHSYFSSVTMALRAVMTLPMPALSQKERVAL